MAHIEGNVSIKASAEQVFDFIADWRNVAECCDGMYDLEVEGDAPRGLGVRYTYMLKEPVGGDRAYTIEVSEYLENRGLTFTAVAGGERVEHWWLVEEPGYPKTTRVIYDLRYKLPLPVVGGLMDSLVAKKQWESRVRHSLAQIKAKVEAPAIA